MKLLTLTPDDTPGGFDPTAGFLVVGEPSPRVEIPCPADTDGDGDCAWCSRPGNVHTESWTGRIAIAVLCPTCRGWTRYEGDGKTCSTCEDKGAVIVATAELVRTHQSLNDLFILNLEDLALTTKRCPSCWGTGGSGWVGDAHSGAPWTPCERCWPRLSDGQFRMGIPNHEVESMVHGCPPIPFPAVLGWSEWVEERREF